MNFPGAKPTHGVGGLNLRRAGDLLLFYFMVGLIQ